MQKSQRERTYKLLIDILPRGSILLTFFFLFFTVTVSISVIFLAPHVHQTDIARDMSKEFEERIDQYLKGELWISASVNNVNRMRQELSFSAYLKHKNVVSGLTKEDVQIELELKGRNNENDQWTTIVEKAPHSRTLTCRENNYFCDPLIIFRERFIKFAHYNVSFRFANLAPVYETKLLDDVIELRFDSFNESYTIFESIFRGNFFLLSFVVTIFYIVYLFKHQKWSYCKTEQKFIIIVLLSIMMFNNPLFIGDWLGGNWFFSFINIFNISTFVAVLTLFVMVVTHSVVTKPKNRTLLWFYMPKFVVVGLIWLTVIITLAYERFNSNYDSGFDLTEVPFFGQIRMAVIGMLGLCVAMIGYYTVRAIGHINKDATSYRYSKRFRYFFILTFLIILATGIDFATFFIIHTAKSAAQFLSFFPLYNYYAITLAIFFLPSNRIEDDPSQTIIEHALQDDDDFHRKYDDDYDNLNVIDVEMHEEKDVEEKETTEQTNAIYTLE